MSVVAIKIDASPLVFTLSFTVKDAYIATPLGCHAGMLGQFSGNVSGGLMSRDKMSEILVAADLGRRIMDGLIKGVPEMWGAPTTDRSSYKYKGHYIVSAPWKRYDDGPLFSLGAGTPEIMDLIAQYCDNEPKTYGTYAMTPPSECVAHSDNAGFPATRTMVWIPPYGKINPDKLTTAYSGVYKPLTSKETLTKVEPIPVSGV